MDGQVEQQVEVEALRRAQAEGTSRLVLTLLKGKTQHGKTLSILTPAGEHTQCQPPSFSTASARYSQRHDKASGSEPALARSDKWAVSVS
jgi:hypothetical protein